MIQYIHQNYKPPKTDNTKNSLSTTNFLYTHHNIIQYKNVKKNHNTHPIKPQTSNPLLSPPFQPIHAITQTSSEASIVKGLVG